MKYMFLLVVVALIGSGCTTVSYNGSDLKVTEISFPEVGEITTVYVGDHMVQKGSVVEESVLHVQEFIKGFHYSIPENYYPQIGSNDTQDFYSAAGISKGALSDPFKALSLSKKEGSKLCVVTVFGGKSCYKGKFSRTKRTSVSDNSFQQTLIYSGRIGNKINISYREFSNNYARPAFNNDVEYDLAVSKTIGYKGANIEVINADNNSITFKLIRNFP